MAQKLLEGVWGAPGEQEQIWWMKLEIPQLINGENQENSVWVASVFYHNWVLPNNSVYLMKN